MHPEGFNNVRYLYRGMADMSVDADTIKSMGCTVLAPCSSTDDKQVALDYAKNRHPLVFVFKTRVMSRTTPVSRSLAYMCQFSSPSASCRYSTLLLFVAHSNMLVLRVETGGWVCRGVFVFSI